MKNVQAALDNQQRQYHPLELFTTEEAAEFLCITPQRLRVWRMRGVGPTFIRLSANRVRYRAQDLVAYCDERRVEQ